MTKRLPDLDTHSIISRGWFTKHLFIFGGSAVDTSEEITETECHMLGLTH